MGYMNPKWNYVQKVKIFKDDDTEYYLRWYPAAPEATLFKHRHRFASPMWQDIKGKPNPDLGEQFNNPRKRVPAVNLHNFRGDTPFCGEASWYFEGVPKELKGLEPTCACISRNQFVPDAVANGLLTSEVWHNPPNNQAAFFNFVVTATNTGSGNYILTVAQRHDLYHDVLYGYTYYGDACACSSTTSSETHYNWETFNACSCSEAVSSYFASHYEFYPSGCSCSFTIQGLPIDTSTGCSCSSASSGNPLNTSTACSCSSAESGIPANARICCSCSSCSSSHI